MELREIIRPGMAAILREVEDGLELEWQGKWESPVRLSSSELLLLVKLFHTANKLFEYKLPLEEPSTQPKPRDNWDRHFGQPDASKRIVGVPPGVTVDIGEEGE